MKNVLIQVKNLEKKFGANIIHEKISFELYEGEVLGLLGHSGAGKSVLMRSIIGLEKIDSGEIYFKNNRIDQLTEEELYPIRTQVSYSFQYSALFDSMSVYENIAYPLYAHTNFDDQKIDEIVMNALRSVNMEKSFNLFPGDLSGGMQKRIGLARAIVLNPVAILYDEPTAGLDPSNIETVLDIILDFKRNGIGGIFCSHDIPAALHVCDRIIIINQGMIEFQGTVNEFKNNTSELVTSFKSKEPK